MRRIHHGLPRLHLFFIVNSRDVGKPNVTIITKLNHIFHMHKASFYGNEKTTGPKQNERIIGKCRSPPRTKIKGEGPTKPLRKQKRQKCAIE